MKFWTVQTTEVLEIIRKNGFYQPDLGKSRYLRLMPDLGELYDFILKSFIRVNRISLPGLVFAFAWSDGSYVRPFDSFADFHTFIREKKPVIDSLWRVLTEGGAVLMELEYADDFNPIYIDVNDFQFLMPPVMMLPPYTEGSFQRICGDISSGKISVSEFPSYLIQAHLPYINGDNIVSLYPAFSLD